MKLVKQYSNTNLKIDNSLKSLNKNIMSCPNLTKITLNIGTREANINSNKILIPLLILKILSGELPKCTKAHSSIANFKLRQGKIIGCKKTLRGPKMFSFLETLIYLVISGNFENKKIKYINSKYTNSITLGIKDCSIFPELENQYNLLKNIVGLNITLTYSGIIKTKDNMFFSGLKIPFKM
jgi:large subunit ribosomal protein L5